MTLSSESAIHVAGLSKMYKVYHRPSDVFWELFSRTPRYKEFWALKNVSFEVAKGEVVGVIGRNGAGKSTLLKIIAGTLDRTAGNIEINGKVSAILELGTGFHPEYTGRENIFLGGMTLGMTRAEVARKIDEIIEFSELQDVIDQPFKTYSTGMRSRLTFSTSISIDPDIFIVDEALSVGDMLFQEKCFRRLREIVNKGSTVFFVTHSLGIIYDLCNSALLLSNGELLLQDTPRAVGYAYEQILAQDRKKTVNKSSSEPLSTVVDLNTATLASRNVEASKAVNINVISNSNTNNRADTDLPNSKNNPKAIVLSYRVLNSQWTEVTSLHYGEEYIIESRIHCIEDIPKLSTGVRIEKPTGTVVYATSTSIQGLELSGKAGEEITMHTSFRCILASGNYLIGGGVSEMLSRSEFSNLHILRGSCSVEVISKKQFGGIFDMQAKMAMVNKNILHP